MTGEGERDRVQLKALLDDEIKPVVGATASTSRALRRRHQVGAIWTRRSR